MDRTSDIGTMTIPAVFARSELSVLIIKLIDLSMVTVLNIDGYIILKYISNVISRSGNYAVSVWLVCQLGYTCLHT